MTDRQQTVREVASETAGSVAAGENSQHAVPTVAQYVVQRLAALGIRHVFGVPGDYSFPFDGAIEQNPDLTFVNSANELNAAYAADGYARVYGAAILTTTYGVGELSALNGVMGSKSERLPVFHLVGQPSKKLQKPRLITHHTLGDGVFDRFQPFSAAAACVSADLTPQNAVAELERVIAEVLAHRQPAYITVAQDFALLPVEGVPVAGAPLARAPRPGSDPKSLSAAIAALAARIEAAEKTVLLPAYTIGRYGLVPEVQRLLQVSGFPYATTIMDKAQISEDHPQFLGMYNGAASKEEVWRAVEEADLVLNLGGVVFAETNTAAWTDNIDSAKTVTVWTDCVEVGDDVFTSVSLADVVVGLTEALTAGGAAKPRPGRPPETVPDAPAPPGTAEELLSSDAFYPRLQRFLREGDVLVADAGLCTERLSSLRLPKGVSFLGQILWGSIGWATPAAFGAALAAPDRRVVLVTGDGAHQLTANEIGAMGRYGVTPVIFVLNNGMFGIEEFLSPRQGHDYNRLALWEYHLIPRAQGCADWHTARVTTIGELEAALADTAASGKASYIEVVLPRSDIPATLSKDVLERLYRYPVATANF